MNNRIFSFVLAFASFAGLAVAQPYTCTATASQQPLRSEGVAEYLADIVVVCNNGVTQSIPPQSLTVTLNANITSRVDQSNLSEATLLINDSLGDNRELGSTVFRGIQPSPNSVRFDSVSVFEPGSGAALTYRFSNIRVDASRFPPGTPIQALVTTTGSTTLPISSVIAGIVQPPQGFAVRTCDDSQTSFGNFLQSAGQNASLAAGLSASGAIQFNVRYSGNFVGSYRKSIDANQNPFVPGIQYNSESNFVDQVVLGSIPGVATQGTRLMSRFNNIPAGVRLFVTRQPLGPGGASSQSLVANLISVDDDGAGSATAVSASAIGVCAASGVTELIVELPIVNGTAQAVWEVTSSSPIALEKASFGVVVAYASAPPSPGLGSATVTGKLGPVSNIATSSVTAPAPRFATSTINIPAFAIGAATGNQLTIITPSPLPSGQLAAAYSLPSFIASGGTPSYAWSVASGSALPPGLTLLTNGTFSGTPTSLGSFSFTIQVNDQTGLLATKPFLITISPAAALTITTASPLPNGVVGTAYSLPSFTATGGSAPYSWTLLPPAILPPGLALLSNGSFSGTPASNGSYLFSVRVIDQVNAISTKTLRITIVPVFTGPSISTASPLAPGTVGSVYSPIQFTATGFSLPISWVVTSACQPPGTNPAPCGVISGAPLPAGLTFSNTGVLSGTPNPGSAGTYNFAVLASNSFQQQVTKQFAITINPSTATTISISPATLPAGITGTIYSQILTATGGIAPYTFTLGSGALPSGLTLSPGGLISGTLPLPGSSLFSVVATDSQLRTVSQAYGVVVLIPTPPATTNNGIAITTKSIPNGFVGADYSASLAATGGATPYTWSADARTLPLGISLSASGVFSGKPTRAGSFGVSVRVSESGGTSDGTVFSITVGGPPLSIVTPMLGNGTVGTAYAGSVQASGGLPPYAFSAASGSLPAGLSLAADGTISGTPTTPGSGAFTVQVSDAALNPQGIATKSFSITVLGNPPVITTISLSNGVLSAPYSGSVAATGGLPPYAFSVASGSLPGGLTLAADGTISGTPTALGDSGVTIQVTDKQQQIASKSFTLKIVALPSITTSSPLGLLIVGTPSGITLAAAGGTLPYTWSVSSGSLPAGLSLDSATGAINGNPSAAGTYAFAATVTEANKLTASKSFTGRITTPVRITTASPLPAATVGTAYSAKIDAGGGTLPYRFSADTLPAGLSIDSSGLITGTPAAAAAGPVRITVTDADSLTASASFTLAVALPQLSAVTIGGVTDTPPPAQQQNITVTLGGTFPVPLTGTVTVTFASDANVPADDPAIQFSTGGRSAAFTIPAGSTQANFTAPNLAIQTGTVSGTITLTTTLLAGGTTVSCNCALTRTIRVVKGTPVITSVRAARGAGVITITIIGFSTSREMTQAGFQFTTAAGANVTTTSFTVPVSTFFTSWYTSTQSAQFGSQFLMTEVFTISGDSNAVTNVSVTLSNAQGTAAAVSAAVQ